MSSAALLLRRISMLKPQRPLPSRPFSDGKIELFRPSTLTIFLRLAGDTTQTLRGENWSPACSLPVFLHCHWTNVSFELSNFLVLKRKPTGFFFSLFVLLCCHLSVDGVGRTFAKLTALILLDAEGRGTESGRIKTGALALLLRRGLMENW